MGTSLLVLGLLSGLSSGSSPLSIAHPPVLHAQSSSSDPSTFAIVGARIIDGSGNEPFEGTVVVRQGRVVEAGRSVKAPEGVRVIDGKGRTVMPGLIDLQAELPREVPNAGQGGAQGAAPGATQSAAQREVLSRAMAAYVYAGVTTIAPAGLTAADVDALRDRVLRAGVRAPRLATPAGTDRLIRGGGSGTGAAPGPQPDAQVVADWRQRNLTYAPALAGSAPADRRAPTTLLKEMTSAGSSAGDGAADQAAGGGSGAGDPAAWKAQLKQTRAVRDAGVRIALGSGADGAGLPHGWATLLAARLLVDAGLTPLQAVTASTSGGAWALGLQSDRGFLAVGQRADLLVVIGDPVAAIADVEKIERVFLGGEEIDRAALRAVIAPPPPPATEASPTAPAGTANTSATPAAGTSAPTGSPEANAAGKPTPDAPAGRGRRAARGKRGAAAAEPPSNNIAASNTAASGATAPGASATGGAGLAPAVVSTPLIDDFEGANSASTLGEGWTAAGESAASTTTVVAGRVVRGLRDHALHLSARMGEARDASARVSMKLERDGRPVDVSRFHGIRFDARGQGRYIVTFVSRSVGDGRHHASFFSGSPNWTPVSIPFASVGQTGNGQRVAWTGRDLIEIVFQFARDPGEMGWLELDNIRFY